MHSLAFATISQLKTLLEQKKVSREELASYFIKRFDKYNAKLGAAIEVFDIKSVLEKSKTEGLLAGIPGILKDNICQKERIASCGSRILKNFRATYDATATKLLKEKGALLLGRANMDEFAMGSSNETSAFGKVLNPWDASRVPGGSSGGSVAAVAAGLVPWALGSETGGSVRLPAAFCGVVGIKPTYGLVSRYGLVAYASSLDQIGVATRTVYDNALVLSAIAEHDLRDATSLRVIKKDYLAAITEPVSEGFTIGVIDNAFEAEGLDPEVKEKVEAVIEQYQKMGVVVKRLNFKSLAYAAAAYFIISRAEAASNLARFDGVRYGYRAQEAETLNEMYAQSRHDGFGPEVRLRILVGNYVLSAGHAGAFYQNAKKVQRMIRKELLEAFKGVNALLAPVQATPAFAFGAYDDNKLQMDLQDYYTCFANLAGVPALSVPCGFSKENLPIGFQLIGPHLSEGLLYRLAYAYEQTQPWHTMHPGQYKSD